MSKLSSKIYAIHGFLGLPSDFQDFDVEAVSVGVAPSLGEWARQFNQRVLLEGGEQKNILLGYSMGGRLALHAYLDRPTLWEEVILVSAHPGLKNGKEERISADAAWATRFEQDPWYEVVADWMAQPVFKGTKGPLRLESDFDRKELAAQLRNFSLGHQDYLECDKALWLVGERDVKLLKTLPQACVVPDAGHRILFDNPGFIKEKLLQFL